MRRWVCVLLAGSLALGGCAGLPPKPAPVTLTDAAPLGELPGGGQWPAPQWWTRYQDPTLDRLVELALASSPTLESAHARFDSARQSVRLAGAATGVQVQAAADANRQRLSDNGLFPPALLGFHWYNQFDLGLQATYTFDWWGKQRDAIEAAMDQAHAAAADRSAAALVLASSVAETYYAWQSDQARLALAVARERRLERQAQIAAVRVRAEVDAPDASYRADAGLAALREQIEALRGSAALRVVTLAALVGLPPSELPPLTARPLPAISAGLPDDARLDLIARRADVAASRWRVEAAEQVSRAARAEFYPDVTIGALAGLSSLDLTRLVEYNSRVPQIGAAVHLPIFDSGLLKARYGASRAALDSAIAGYREAVVGAAREVAAAAASRGQIAAQRAQRAAAFEAAQRLDRSTGARARQGLSDARPELATAEALLEQRDGLLLLDAAAVTADIDLQRALGGGYDGAASPATSTKTSGNPTP